MTGFVLRALISAIGLWIATRWVSGIRIDDAATLVLAGALLGIIVALIVLQIYLPLFTWAFKLLGFSLW